MRCLQRRLWVAAKRSPGRRFHALYDHIGRSDVLVEAWRRVRANRGAAGVDRQTLDEVERYGVERFLEEGFDFLGCHLHKRMSGALWERKRQRVYFLQRWPSQRSLKRIRQRVKVGSPGTELEFAL